MRSWFKDTTVVLSKVAANYASRPPFHPSTAYPEYRFDASAGRARNAAYDGVREAFVLLGLDADRVGGADWNPLREIVKPGDTVVLKPNLIRESHLQKRNEWIQVVTHGSVVRAVADYVFLALGGEGRVVIADGPQTDSNFTAIVERTGLDAIADFYRERGLSVELLDLRRDRWYQKGDVIYRRERLSGDPAGYTHVDLGRASEFCSYELSGKYYGADYDADETRRFHTNGRHEYVLCRTVMDADVVINLPKLKTHKKVGVTLSLKNMVGINGYRNCLPHHTIGTHADGGDEFPDVGLSRRLESRAITTFKRLLVARGGGGGAWARAIKRMGASVFGETSRVIRSGNWHGNETAWRMVIDLNKVLFYYRGDAQRRREPLRYLTLVDGIIAGDGDGPASPDVKAAGVIVAGCNPVAVDTVCATIMGFNPEKLPVVSRAWAIEDLPLAGFPTNQIECRSNLAEWTGSLRQVTQVPHLKFKPHFGWTGRIEQAGRQEAGVSK